MLIIWGAGRGVHKSLGGLNSCHHHGLYVTRDCNLYHIRYIEKSKCIRDFLYLFAMWVDRCSLETPFFCPLRRSVSFCFTVFSEDITLSSFGVHKFQWIWTYKSSNLLRLLQFDPKHPVSRIMSKK